MLPWQRLDSVKIPGEAGSLELYKRDQEFSIRLDNYELMNSRRHGSEDALAELCCKKIKSQLSPRVLIGGLGMGFTLAAALNHLASKAEVVVAELVGAVIRWNQEDLGKLSNNPLNDPRVTVIEADVAQIIKNEQTGFTAILLDVDNGPEGLTRAENDQLYGLNGLITSRQALSENGILAIWSAGPDKRFSKRLKKAGFKVEEFQIKPHRGAGGKKHTIWLANT